MFSINIIILTLKIKFIYELRKMKTKNKNKILLKESSLRKIKKILSKSFSDDESEKVLYALYSMCYTISKAYFEDKFF